MMKHPNTARRGVPSRLGVLAALLIALAFAATTPAAAEESDTPAENGSVDLIERYGNAAQELMNQGMEYLGIRYRFGGNSPATGLDCSGLVQNVFRNALGLNLPRTAREMARLGDKVGLQDLKPGDLVFFNTMRRTFSHVGIYMGEGRFLHAPASGGRVRIDEIGERYWSQRFNGARRLLPDADAMLPR
ncbi:C40 family peptidase [Aromatoleum aromaticum]|uniref:C40 family peptidase n=1 Tax=Aromatoleum aromaticum TaxID=551760 RepID=UPI0014597ABE|nr:C40 family peptidase [Aromatoleum aromaticum]NMG54983.1 glycoside hydrolase [Aromatoleum aromaticum]